MNRRRGFTLLEVLVATMIMAIAVVGLLAGISTATRNAARLTAYDRAVALARLQMNNLLVDFQLPHDTVITGQFPEDESGGLESGWKARLSMAQMPPAPVAGQLALERIELEVWWMGGAVRRSFTLEGFRYRVLLPADIPPPVPAQ
ncbi:MAG TPA: type II secretion system protein [Bryobacteraceae bacterium]|nr:type II secretion system protein [Bryobacteraceae bacterium]